MKKGKACKQAVDLLLGTSPAHHSGAGARERELLRAIPDTELVAAMVGNAKLSMPGMQAALKKGKGKGK